MEASGLSRKDEIFNEAFHTISRNDGRSPQFLENFYSFSFCPNDEDPTNNDNQDEPFRVSINIPGEITGGAERRIEYEFYEPNWIQFAILKGYDSALQQMLTDLSGIISSDPYDFLNPTESNTPEPLIHLAAKCGQFSCLQTLKRSFDHENLIHA